MLAAKYKMIVRKKCKKIFELLYLFHSRCEHVKKNGSCGENGTKMFAPIDLTPDPIVCAAT